MDQMNNFKRCKNDPEPTIVYAHYTAILPNGKLGVFEWNEATETIKHLDTLDTLDPDEEPWA